MNVSQCSIIVRRISIEYYVSSIMEIIRKQKIILIAVAVLIVGLIATILLVSQRQQHKAKAEFDVSRSFNISTDTQGTQPIPCQGVTCTTNSDTVHIKFNPANTQDLLNSLP